MTARQPDGCQQQPESTPRPDGLFRYHKEPISTTEDPTPLPLSPRWKWKLAHWRQTWLGRWRRQHEPRPRLCPSCGALVGAQARRCTMCGTHIRFSLAGSSQWLARLLPGEAPATGAIFFFCCLLYGVSLLVALRLGAVPVRASLMQVGAVSPYVLVRLGARQTLLILHGQWWRLITSVFLHAGLLHIAMNMWVLLDIGPLIEELYGSALFLFLFVCTGALSMAASTAWNWLTTGGIGLAVGASGALMGLIGVLLAVSSRHRFLEAQFLRSQLVRWIIYVILFGLLVPGIDNAAHLGGLATGYLLGWVLADHPPTTAAERRRAYALAWLAGLGVLLSFGAAIVHWG